MPQKTNLAYFLCAIIKLGYYHESGKVGWAVGVVSVLGALGQMRACCCQGKFQSSPCARWVEKEQNGF